MKIMKRLLAFDKLLHFGACLVIAAFLGAVLPLIGIDDGTALAVAFMGSMLVGVAKELLDEYVWGGHFDVFDLCADFIGAVIGCFSAII